jgi:Spy/CpxP family protein refolding chaperone
MLAARVATRVAVRAILTPEQRTKLKSLRPPRPMDGPPGPPR